MEGMGPLIAHSKAPLVSAAECAAVIEECEARAERLGGWTTERHENYPTTDVPVQRVQPVQHSHAHEIHDIHLRYT
eukprot:5967677-Pyramimonas_sp.AAC.3